MQALQMDIASLVPVQAMRIPEAATLSGGLATWKKPKDPKDSPHKLKKKGRDGHRRADQGAPCRSLNGAHGELPGPPGLILPVAPVRSENGFGPLDSGAWGPVASGNSASEDVRPPANTRVESGEVKSSRHSSQPEPSSPKRTGSGGEGQAQKSERVASLHSDHNSKAGSVKSRRNSVSLNRAVSKANITEVFKVREQELTADLHDKTPSVKASPLLSAKDVPKKGGSQTVQSVRSVKSSLGSVREKHDVPSSAHSVSDDESEDSDADTMEGEEVEFVEIESRWLKLSPLNTFITCYVSKALGLVPLFDFESDTPTWKNCSKHWASRLYHWNLALERLA
eukprot:Skav217218  [mRNA]  locus=scaffold143:319342:320358:- [translate_table: standard]